MKDLNNRKAQIISTSALLFQQKGYDACSVRDIANELNMEAASLYHHFKSKEEILSIICFEMANKLIAAMDETNDIYFNAEQKLRMAIEQHVGIIVNDLSKSAVFLFEWKRLNEPFLTEFKTLRNHYENGFKQIITEGIQEDVFDDVDSKFAVLSVLSSVNWIIEWYKPTGNMQPKEIAKKMSDFVLGGLRKKLVTDSNYKQ
jgi:AcrR family transcriptional regulator